MNANHLKIEFIKWLMHKYDNGNIVIGNEVLFSSDKRRADIVMFMNNKMYAYEIKSDSDNLIDIEEQLNKYLTTFNYTFLVITEKHLKHINKLFDYNLGIILFKDSKFKILQNSLLSKQILKENLVEFLSYKELRKMYKPQAINKKSIHEYRSIVSQKCLNKDIQKYAYLSLRDRYAKLYKLFLSDIMKDSIMLDDLKSLTGNITSDVLH